MGYRGPGAKPVGFYTDENGEVHPIMPRRSTSSTEPTIWSTLKRHSTRGPRDPHAGRVRHTRAMMRTAARHNSTEAYNDLGSADVGMMSAPPKDWRKRGEWDWFGQLHPDEQRRLRRAWFQGPGAPGYHHSHPDQVADKIAQHWGGEAGGTDHDERIHQWLERTRVADAGATLARGRTPKPSAYGNLELRNVVGDDLPYNPETVFDRDTRRAGAHIAAVDADEETYREERARRFVRTPDADRGEDF